MGERFKSKQEMRDELILSAVTLRAAANWLLTLSKYPNTDLPAEEALEWGKAMGLLNRVAKEQMEKAKR